MLLTFPVFRRSSICFQVSLSFQSNRTSRPEPSGRVGKSGWFPFGLRGTWGSERPEYTGPLGIRFGRGREVTYRPMDQVKINVVNTEVLQSGIEALLNALVGGVRELACDLPNRQPMSTQTVNKSGQPGSMLSTYEDLRPRYPRLAYTLSHVFFIVIQPIGAGLPLSSRPVARNDQMRAAVLTKRNRCVYTRSLTRARRH